MAGDSGRPTVSQDEVRSEPFQVSVVQPPASKSSGGQLGLAHASGPARSWPPRAEQFLYIPFSL